MIDWHCHILPGLDDGAADIQQSLAMASALVAAGFHTVYCTPHRMPGCYDADNNQVRQGVFELQQELKERNIPLTLLSGCEYSLDEYLLASLDDPLTLGESRLILVEILPRLTAEMVRQVLYGVVLRGFTPVIAHPERCQLLEPVRPRAGESSLLITIKSLFSGDRSHIEKQQKNFPSHSGNSLLDYLRDLGCSFQGNLGSFKGYYGRRVQHTAQSFKELGLYDRFGSDLHAPEQVRLILSGCQQL